ncbi:unnamed protein product [Paramecium pentaurelia]|uniref:Uncharacterized protein n=1 Tax=Paramecium pentaurelia TaxID=43138 RepID=A0A8S1SJB1_9CILI|nr:unnamed protein product [Paramecium pentaurelia]
MELPPIPILKNQSQFGIDNLVSQTHIYNTQTQNQETTKPFKRNFNLKVGDIVYFKSYLTDDYKGVISGDGIASNKLECIQILGKNQQIIDPSKKSLQQKVGSLTFQKSLFQVITGKKYHYQNFLEQERSRSIDDIREQAINEDIDLDQCQLEYEGRLKELEDKANEEILENQRFYDLAYGSNIVYGQEIQLKHIYSSCILSFNSAILAKENCCRELSLEEISNLNSNFRILSMNQVKNPGEPILYGDQIIVQNSSSNKWFMNIQKPNQKYDKKDGLEVNCSQIGFPLKIACYVDSKTEQEIKQQIIKQKALLSGDVVTIKNRYLGGYLSIQRQLRITEGLDKKEVFIKNYDTNITYTKHQFYFDVEQVRNEKIEYMYKLYVDSSTDAENNLNNLWQIQHVDSLTFSKPNYESVFLIRHVCTGLFLEISHHSANLTYDGLRQECQFHLRSKKTLDDQILFSEAYKLQSVMNVQIDGYVTQENLVIVCLDDRVAVQRKSQKQNIERETFLLKLATPEQAKTAFRINSLQEYLIQFYIFLQDWGMLKTSAQGLEVIRTYDYFEAFNNQKILYDEILQLFQTLENLKLYLNNEGQAQTNEQQQFKQKALMDNDIINLLFAIQRLCNFMIYGSLSNNNSQIQDKTPQKIAKAKLDPPISSSQKLNCIQEIYDVLSLCVQKNQDTSNYILTLKMNKESILDFLLQQLKYQRKYISNLIKESVRYTDMSESKENIKKWVNQLENLSEENIEDQTLYIEILSLIMIDPYENPNKLCQNACRRLLFGTKNQQEQQYPFHKVLVSLDIQEENNNYYPIVQFYPKREKGLQMQYVNEFGQNNQLFCQLYLKFIDKQARIAQRFLNKRPSLIDVVIDFFTIETLKENQLVKQEDAKLVIPIFQKYENYLMNVMGLYSSLCKGRNQKNIKCLMRNCFLNQKFLEICLKRQQNIKSELRFEKTLIELFCNLFLDIDPLIKISQNYDPFYNNITQINTIKCYLSDDIDQFDIQNPSGLYFYENNASKSLKRSDDYQSFLHSKETKAEHQQLKLYAAKMLSRTHINDVRLYYLEMFTKEDYPEHLLQEASYDIFKSKKLSQNNKQKYDYSRLAYLQLHYFLGLLTIIKNSINLGYNQLDENQKIFSILPNIFVALILQQIPDMRIHRFSENESFISNLNKLRQSIDDNIWVVTFLPTNEQLYEKRKSKHKNLDKDYKRMDQSSKLYMQFQRNWILYMLIWTYQYCNDEILRMQVYLEALSILKIFEQLKLNLQILEFLFSSSQQNESNPSSPSFRDYDQFGFDEVLNQEIQIKKSKTPNSKSIYSVFKEPDGNSISGLLFTCLLTSGKRNKLNEELLKRIIQSFHAPKYSIQEINQVEIIDNLQELRYFSIINGNSNSVQLMSPKEAIQLSKRALKFIISQKDNNVNQKRITSFDLLKGYSSKIIEQFELFFKPNSQDFQYLKSFQNILRNANIHLVFLKFLVDPEIINSSNDIVFFYKRIVLFLEYFIIDNDTNIAILADNQYLFKILDVIQIPQPQAEDKFYIPIKITKLAIKMISTIPENQHDNLINKIFLKIYNIGNQLMQSQEFYLKVYCARDENEEIKFIKRSQHENAVAYFSLIQYFKILRSMTKTYEKPAKQAPLNKHLILSKILKDNFLRIVLDPVNYYKDILVPELVTHEEDAKDPLLFHRMKLHSELITLITECCQYYRLGIQEMQRILLYEQLKTILLAPNSEYIVKRAYLQCLFELYINQVKQGQFINDTIESDEVRDILSRVIIPELDQKQICKYLEGLSKLANQDRNIKVIQRDLRDQIKRQKQTYFENKLSFDSKFVKEQGILRDLSEYWKYLRKNGVIHFLIYTYDEIKDRIDLENPEIQNLSDEFAIIKQNFVKIKEIFNVLERDFRVKKEDLDLDDYRQLIISIEEIIPQRKITKFGQNFRIGFQQDKNDNKLIFDKFDTLKDDQTGEKKLQEEDNVQRIENPFRRNFKVYLIRYKVNINQFNEYIESKANEQERLQKILDTCNIYKTYIQQKDIDEIYKMNVEQIKRQEQINNRNNIVSQWDLFKQAMRELFEMQTTQNVINQQVQTYQRQQEGLENLKQQFGIACRKLIGKQYKKHGGQLEGSEDLLSDDIQIELLIKTLEQQNTNLLIEDNVQEFLQKCQEIFLNREVYLIKFCKIFLFLKRPTQDDIDSLTEAKDEKSKDIIRQKQQIFIKYQNAMVDGGLDIIALDILNESVDDQHKIEALQLLIYLLDYGNDYVQKKFYNILKQDQIIKSKFFVFLRGFFLTDINSRILELELCEDNNTEYKILCLKVLKLLQALCENVNVDFQKFLVRQYDDDSYQANINIVNEVASLLADLLEKGQSVFYKLQEIYRQALESLVEFSTGFEENKKELCKNTRLFTLLNQILQKEDLISFKQLQQENRNILKENLLKSQNQEEDLIINLNKNQINYQERKYNSYQTLQSFIKLLLLITQGKLNKKSLKFIIETVNITILMRISRSIYQDRIKPKQRNIILDNICDESKTGQHQYCSNNLCHFGLRTDEDNLLIQTGFNIFIICLKLSEHFPNDPQLEIFKFDEEYDEQDDFTDFSDPLQEELQKKNTVSSQKIVPIFIKNQNTEKEEENALLSNRLRQTSFNEFKQILEEIQNDDNYKFTRKQQFFKFYRQFTGRIEIQNEQSELEKIFFQKPFVCNFVTPNIKQHLIYEIKRDTDEDRMQGLIDQADFYQVQMRHSQQINNSFIMHFGAVYWRLLKDISFILCSVIVILLIFMHDIVVNSKLGSNQEAPESNTKVPGENFVSYLNNIITIIQLVLNLIIVFFCAIERYPISITYNRGETNAKKVQILKKEAGFSIAFLTMKYYSIIGYFEQEFQGQKVSESTIKKLILVIFFDFDNFYNICIFGLTVYAFFNPYIYAVLLLDIIKRSEDLQNIIKSITSNGRNLAIFSFLGFIGLLIYAIIAFSNFSWMFNDEDGVYGQTFILAVTSTINFGLRSGLGDSMKTYPQPYEDPTLYWGRYFFDFSFFIIFNILFIQIIFGIILDTFGELRDERQALVKEIEGKCFVCSLEKNDIDTNGSKGWHYHIYLEHSVYHMLYYIIYIKNKDLNDCNALEKFVKRCIDGKETAFFPFGRALQIEDQNNDEDELIDPIES